MNTTQAINQLKHIYNAPTKFKKVVDAKTGLTWIEKRLPDGRIRYYSLEIPASKQGLTGGASYVTEWNPNNGQVRSWMESYNHSGKLLEFIQRCSMGKR